MSIINFRNEPTAVGDSPCDMKSVSRSTLDRSAKSLIKYLVAVYGGSPKFLSEFAVSAATFVRKLKIGNSRFKAALNFVEYGVPAMVLTGDIFTKVMEFDRITKEKPNVYSEKEVKIRRLLGLKEHDANKSIVGGSFIVGKDVCQWISARPNTKRFIVEGFYKYDDLKLAKELWEVERGDVFVVINFEEKKFVWELSYIQYEDKLTVNDSTIYMLLTKANGYKAGMRTGLPSEKLGAQIDDNGIDNLLSRLKNSVFQDFLEHFDMSKNVIYINKGLAARRRMIFEERVNQYDIDGFADEIRKVLKRGRKRGYAFVGVPGTGKSTIIRKLENTIRDYPIVYISADNTSYENEIKETFTTIGYMQPCIVIIEDLDSFGFEKKNNRLGAFLNGIDDVNRNLNVVFIATINDTKMVHYTLINRPGRLDEIILVEPPKTPQEAYEVMEARFGKITKTDTCVKKSFPKIEDIDPAVFDSIIQNKMTQADVCELIEKAVLLKDEITNESLQESVKALMNSKQAIKVCDFGGKNPYDTDDLGECLEISAPA